jgi:predicted TIM-barrel fold metal-dependent hydrolase
MKPDIEKDIYTFYEKYRIKGIKIEGTVDKTNPLKYADSPLTDTLKELKLRILFHTDSNSYANPQDILKFARYTGIKCQLAHACRLDAESLKQLREMNNIVTDLSPIQHIMEYKERRLSNKQFKDYGELISYVINLAGRDKVVAGTDYNYQGWTEKSYDYEWNIFEKYCSRDILYKNASKFWGLE